MSSRSVSVVESCSGLMSPCAELYTVLRTALKRGRLFPSMPRGVPHAVECVELRVGDGEETAYRIRVMELRDGDLRVELEIDGVTARGKLHWV